MTTSTPKRKRENGRERLERELTAYLGFWAEIHPRPMLGEYPARERTGELVAARIARYGRRFPR